MAWEVMHFQHVHWKKKRKKIAECFPNNYICIYTRK